MITLDHAFLADYAADRGNSIGAMGIGIDTLLAQQLPVIHPHLFLVTQLRCSADDRNVHAIAVDVVGSDGKPILQQAGNVDFRAMPPNQEGVARLLFGFYLIQFPRAEEYNFVIKLDEQVVREIPFLILTRQEAPTA